MTRADCACAAFLVGFVATWALTALDDEWRRATERDRNRAWHRADAEARRARIDAARWERDLVATLEGA